MTTKGTVLTVGELKSMLSHYEDDIAIDFSGLDFYRLKKRGPRSVQIEFNQAIYIDQNDRVQITNCD